MKLQMIIKKKVHQNEVRSLSYQKLLKTRAREKEIIERLKRRKNE